MEKNPFLIEKSLSDGWLTTTTKGKVERRFSMSFVFSIFNFSVLLAACLLLETWRAFSHSLSLSTATTKFQCWQDDSRVFCVWWRKTFREMVFSAPSRRISQIPPAQPPPTHIRIRRSPTLGERLSDSKSEIAFSLFQNSLSLPISCLSKWFLNWEIMKIRLGKVF